MTLIMKELCVNIVNKRHFDATNKVTVSHPCLVAEKRHVAEVSGFSDIRGDIMQCVSLIFYRERTPAVT